MRNFFSHRRNKGFTIVELMVSLSVLTLLSLGTAEIYLNYTASTRDLKAANLIYEEARFLMEKLVKEVRQGAIDYEQYYNKNLNIPINGGTYGDDYCHYDRFFYDNGPDGNRLTFDDNESIGRHNEDLDIAINTAVGTTDPIKAIENELYLINISGNRRTMLSHIEKVVNGETIGKVAMSKLVGQDFGDDGIKLFTAREIVKAVARGFNPDIALQLLKPDYTLDLIEMKEITGKSKNNLLRLKGRVIGKGGKAREETHGCLIAVVDVLRFFIPVLQYFLRPRKGSRRTQR